MQLAIGSVIRIGSGAFSQRERFRSERKEGKRIAELTHPIKTLLWPRVKNFVDVKIGHTDSLWRTIFCAFKCRKSCKKEQLNELFKY